MAVLEGDVIANTPEAWTARAAAASSHEASGWTAAGQAERFAAVLAALDPQPGERLLDFGCGTGELVERLPAGVTYVGYDPAAGMIDRARSEHPGKAFHSTEPNLRSDLIACVGPWNLPDHWSKQMTWMMLRRLWDATGRALAACLYAGDDPRCLTYTQAEVEKFARSESYYWRIDRHRPNDLLLVLSRKALA